MRRCRQGLIAIVSVALVVSVSCIHRSTRPPSGAPLQEGASASTVVGAAELLKVGQGQTLRTALERTRPWFFTGRGGAPVVSIDDGPAADVSVLNMIPVVDVREVRFQRATTNVGRSIVRPNGDVATGDVILVLTRAR